MNRTLPALVALAAFTFLAGLVRADEVIVVEEFTPPSAIAAGPVEVVPVPPPVGVPEYTLAPPTVVEQLAVVDSGVRRPWTVGVEVGGGWGGASGTLRKPPGFAPHRPLLFPIPSADIDVVLAARAGIACELGPLLPGRVSFGWEHYSGSGDAILYGFDPNGALFLRTLKAIQDDHRERDDRDDHRYHDFRDDLVNLDLPDMKIRDVPAPDMVLRSHVSVNLVDFVYSTPIFPPAEPAFGPGLVFRAKLGSKAGWIYAYDRADGAGYSQLASNSFSGVGPLAGLQADFEYGDLSGGRRPAFTIAVDGGVLFGESKLRFKEVDLLARNPVYREAAVVAKRNVPFVSTEMSFGVHTGPVPGAMATVGARYTQYFGVGKVGNSDQDVMAIVGFLRYEVPF